MSERVALVNAELVDPERAAPHAGSLLVEGGRIAAVLEPGAALPGDCRRVEVAGAFIAPGFIDVHFHGACATAPEGRLSRALEADRALMRAAGTTSFLATTLCWPHERLGSFVSEISELSAARPVDAPECLGVHLEGPWISPEVPGALAREAIRGFEPARDLELFDRAEGRVRLVTLAPERLGATPLLDALAQRGIVAALGHSCASAEQIGQAVEHGLRHATHLFNAMGPMHHREPGVAASVLDESRLSADLICDGHHVHPAMLRLAARVLQSRLLLISDRLELPGLEAAKGDAADAPLRTAEGAIAGSRLDMARAVERFREFSGAGLCEAVAAASFRPAQLLGIENERGTLRPGARADFAVLDGAGRVAETWIGGRPAR